MTKLNRDALLKACSPESLITTEKHFDILGGTVLIRELSAQQKMDSIKAANVPPTKKDEQPQFSSALHNAIVIQMAVLDPETKESLLTVDDIPILTDGRAGAIEQLSKHIWELSEATPDYLKSGDSGSNERQQDTRDRAQTAGARRGRSTSTASESHHD